MSWKQLEEITKKPVKVFLNPQEFHGYLLGSPDVMEDGAVRIVLWNETDKSAAILEDMDGTEFAKDLLSYKEDMTKHSVLHVKRSSVSMEGNSIYYVVGMEEEKQTFSVRIRRPSKRSILKTMESKESSTVQFIERAIA